MNNSSLRLLLIDDDALDRQSVMRSLRQSAVVCEIVEATNAQSGLAFASEQHFDAILLDYRLPDQDGIEVLRLLRNGPFESVVILMLSGVDDELIAERCLQLGAQDFLLKTEVTGRGLIRSVRQARQRYVIENELKESREQLRQLSEHDQLTGLINRRGFELALETAVARVRRSKSNLAVLLLDLDDFKSVNDTLGHEAGDRLLIEIARRLGTVVRDSDILCRLGGDEFVVLMTNFEHEDQPALLADRIVVMLQCPISTGVTEQIITTSIGIALLDVSTNNGDDLLKFADVAMYQAKQDGRNQSRFYSASLQETVEFRSLMKNDLYKALEREEFLVFYQAQINSVDGSLGGMEALVRWQHPRFGLLSPIAFMSVAEETGLIVDIGNWVLRQSCQQLKEWQQRFPAKCSNLVVAVNLSAIQIKQIGLAKLVFDVLAESGLDAGNLELEITESALIRDPSSSVAVLSAIAEQGIHFSLDDFGTGYSSLDHLKLFPVTVLKIDKGFISTIGDSAKSERLLMAIIAFAKALEMKVVAEGVETKEQAAFCIRYGCDLLQGYYYSRPIPASEFEAAFLL
ncbi:EAL domain-containing protein [Undibacterium sp. 5I1]|uniref:putative bifunctional diguanylate cyclase/phosphodiesterase n=1 Tax=unclassified Undibacterium TaxID=2630295 RepID=UPI002AB4405E|nr:MULTISPECIES: EAL domain-containing protein [unclassified Undibacterium]MDY7540173.1 EAL domain-containing protein [Undibacterium sp. 5I1]MEB0230580.1 EAL domain-containing protein [Undibacterium sp. 10I3]MEB0257100.1 EAL domain-containing protein [Undibacterium sp. 5I1]